MKKTIALLIMFVIFSPLLSNGQYDSKYVETKTLIINGETYAIEKLLRKDEKIKVKYFAFKDGKTSVYQRYQAWSANKNIVAVSSGTYMTACEAAAAKPVGLCVDNGKIVNENLRNDMDGLLIVYATGGVVAANLKDGVSLKINGKDTMLDVRNNTYQRELLLDWSQSEEATLFQSHLFVYKNQLKINANSSPAKGARRFLAACRTGGSVVYYIINMKTPATLHESAVKAFNYLKDMEEVDVVYMINLDTGCQDVFKIFDKVGKLVVNPNFSGTYDVPNAVNLLVYYYE